MWVRDQLAANAKRPLRSWASELVERLLWRSQRIAMSKLDLRNPRAPRSAGPGDRARRFWRKQMQAGNGEPGMRIPRLISMMTGAGALGSDGETWWLTNEGAAFLA